MVAAMAYHGLHMRLHEADKPARPICLERLRPPLCMYACAPRFSIDAAPSTAEGTQQPSTEWSVVVAGNNVPLTVRPFVRPFDCLARGRARPQGEQHDTNRQNRENMRFAFDRSVLATITGT